MYTRINHIGMNTCLRRDHAEGVLCEKVQFESCTLNLVFLQNTE